MAMASNVVLVLLLSSGALWQFSDSRVADIYPTKRFGAVPFSGDNPFDKRFDPESHSDFLMVDKKFGAIPMSGFIKKFLEETEEADPQFDYDTDELDRIAKRFGPVPLGGDPLGDKRASRLAPIWRFRPAHSQLKPKRFGAVPIQPDPFED